MEELARAGRLELTLVDHNELSPRQTWAAKSVVAIIDHHKDAELYKDTVKAGDVHEDRHKTFLNRIGSPAISLKKNAT